MKRGQPQFIYTYSAYKTAETETKSLKANPNLNKMETIQKFLFSIVLVRRWLLLIHVHIAVPLLLIFN